MTAQCRQEYCLAYARAKATALSGAGAGPRQGVSASRAISAAGEQRASSAGSAGSNQSPDTHRSPFIVVDRGEGRFEGTPSHEEAHRRTESRVASQAGGSLKRYQTPAGTQVPKDKKMKSCPQAMCSGARASSSGSDDSEGPQQDGPPRLERVSDEGEPRR